MTAGVAGHTRRMGFKRWHANTVVPLLEELRGKPLERLRARIQQRLRKQPDPDLRAALAAHYRLQGVGSQAARWGVTVSGWSTTGEIRDLRHWLLGRFVGEDEIRELLFLEPDQSLPPEVADLADPAFRSRGHERPGSSGGACVSVIVMALLALITLVSCIYAVVWWLPRLWQPFADQSELSLGATSLVVLAVSAVGLAVAWLVFWRATRMRCPAPDSFRPLVSQLFPTDLAWSLADQGDVRGASILLKAILKTGSEPQQARRALVQLSRDMGRSDMAGRWGIAVTGLTTPDEQRAFAGAVRARGGTASALRELSLMRYDEKLTAEATLVLALVRNAAQTALSTERS